MVNKPFIRPYFWGGGTWPGGGWLTSHNPTYPKNGQNGGLPGSVVLVGSTPHPVTVANEGL